jgi:hypothetical protein
MPLREAQTDNERLLLDVLEDVIWQACLDRDGKYLDSNALSAYARGMRLLHEYGKIDIEHDAGRRVIAKVEATDATPGA